MAGTTLPSAARPVLHAPPGGSAGWSADIGAGGLVVVAAVALIAAVNASSAWIATEPFSSWFPTFLYYVARNAINGIAILLAAVWVRRRFPAQGAAQYAAAAGAIVVVTAIVLISFQVLDILASGGPFYFGQPDFSPAMQAFRFVNLVFKYSVIGLLVVATWLYLNAEAEHAAAAEQCAIDAERMDRQTAEARLQVLEAQIEPHFLFNTLAHVKRLYETDGAAGAKMLHNLADYLAGALTLMRTTSTLGRELDHVRAYLEIQQIRMGRRLAFAIEAPQALQDMELPPLMVLTLVENAVKHGLGALPEGGRIDVRASVAGGRVIIEVADTGQGFARSSGGGTGLANTRARLASKYGAGASLALALNHPHGVVATIALPHLAGGTDGNPA